MTRAMRMTTDRNRQRLLYIVVGLVIGAIATSLVWSASGGSSEVRLAARVLEDGRVEVALQQPVESHRVSDDTEAPQWSDLNLPSLRFLANDAEPDRWFYSSAITLELDARTPPAVTEIGPFEIAGTPTGNRPVNDQTLLCVITHGDPTDFFWFQVYSALADAAYWNDISLRAEMYEAGADQAMAIDRCVEDGAAAIAVTLADPQAPEASLERAAAAGVRLVSFNSGSDQATVVGASAHVSLDETAVGLLAAQEFADRGVSGDLLCIIHESTNRGLEQRCDSLEAAYAAGSVIRVRLNESETDAESVIAASVSDAVGGALALNANSAYAMVDAISAEHPDLALAAVSADFPRPFAMLYSERLSFVLWPHALEQGYHSITALLFAHGTPFPSESGLFAEATQIAIQPTVITPQSVRALFEADNQFRENLPAWIDALERAIDAETVASNGEQ